MPLRALSTIGGGVGPVNSGGLPGSGTEALDQPSRHGHSPGERPLTLGIFENSINSIRCCSAASMALRFSPRWRTGQRCFTAPARRYVHRRTEGTTGLSGIYGASSLDQFVIGTTVYNASLTPVGTLAARQARLPRGSPSRTSWPSKPPRSTPAGPGNIQRVDLNNIGITCVVPHSRISAVSPAVATASATTGTTTTAATSTAAGSSFSSARWRFCPIRERSSPCPNPESRLFPSLMTPPSDAASDQHGQRRRPHAACRAGRIDQRHWQGLEHAQRGYPAASPAYCLSRILSNGERRDHTAGPGLEHADQRAVAVQRGGRRADDPAYAGRRER